LAILNDVQMAPLAMPGMVVGENRFVYTDRSPGPRKARITHDWVERSTSQPPAAPAVAVFPLDDRRTSNTDFTFAWSPSDGADDYHFELSDRADFAWPLSSNFEKLVSNTAERGRARYRLSSAGLLTPEQKYYWHVRARNSDGVWGPWSRTWSFTPGGPAVPLEARVEDGVLRWKAGAARYRIYASDEKGFSVSDEPADLVVGVSRDVPSRTAANFVAETDQRELVVVGPRAANKAYYRIVAVDRTGARSGPSDVASAPRPLIPADPSDQAKVGESYRGSVSVIRSLGDLRLQWVDGRETASFWDVETPRFALQRGPSWLRIDERTGALEGVPDAAGTFDVTVTVLLERSVRRLHDGGPKPWNLGWGKDPTREVATERAGETSRRFQITVRR
jgi:hypothetical protein